MVAKPHRMYKRHAHYRKLDASNELTPLDYCQMLNYIDLPDEAIAEHLGVTVRIVKRMRDRDYLPKTKDMQEKIKELYMDERKGIL